MRDIKFRAYIKDINDTVPVKLIDFYKESVQLDAELPYGGTLKLDEITLMQYTGLKDKNGKEIYEGDILQTFYGKENTPLITTVYFDKEGYWESKNLSKEKPFKVCYAGFNKCEVIGNIYENKDLLEG